MSDDLLAFRSMVKNKQQLKEWTVDLALGEFQRAKPNLELSRIRALLQEQVAEDPYLDMKLEWLSGFLSELEK